MGFPLGKQSSAELEAAAVGGERRGKGRERKAGGC